MKQKFSIKWKASKQPRKQRKYLANAPLHVKRKFMSAMLEKSLKVKYKRRSLEIRKGDEVLIMRGKQKKKKGKIVEINMMKLKVGIENLQITKRDGTKVNMRFAPSNLKIVSLNLEDRKRLKGVKIEEKEKKEDKKESKEVKKEDKTEVKQEKKDVPEKK